MDSLSAGWAPKWRIGKLITDLMICSHMLYFWNHSNHAYLEVSGVVFNGTYSEVNVYKIIHHSYQLFGNNSNWIQ